MIYLTRLRQTPNKILLQTPQFKSLLYGWSQAGDADHVQAWVTEETATDDGFIRILESMGGKNEPLQQLSVRIDNKALTTFFPSADEVTERLIQISGNANDLSDRAQTLLDAIAAANGF
jgi:predicted KAP-like P-loop ATPase